MQIHSSYVNIGFMELSKLAGKAGGKAVGQPKCVTCQIMKLITLYYRFLTTVTSPCRRLQLPLMGFLVACQEGDEIQRVLMINTGRKRKPKHPSAASDDLCVRAWLCLLQCSFDV